MPKTWTMQVYVLTIGKVTEKVKILLAYNK